eukprot:PhM_4_TR436/c0_g1_i1/m.20095/K04885/KCNB1; potassium voltage-gated channel Shab-related subfamily B member 1
MHSEGSNGSFDEEMVSNAQQRSPRHPPPPLGPDVLEANDVQPFKHDSNNDIYDEQPMSPSFNDAAAASPLFNVDDPGSPMLHSAAVNPSAVADNLKAEVTEEPTGAHDLFRRHMWYIVAAPDEIHFITIRPWESTLSRVFQILSLTFVLLSVTGLCIESLPEFTNENNEALAAMEATSIAFFTLELVLKFYSTPSRAELIRSMMTIIDIVSIIPFYIELFSSSSGAGVLIIFRVVRLVRVFRVFKLSKYNQDIQLVFTTIARSRNAISLLIFLLAIALTIFSSLMYFAEQSGANFFEDDHRWVRHDGTISPYQSIPHSMWWCIVTLTTVGYGDDVPVTALGKIVASTTMLVGVLVIAFPTMILGKNFADVCSEYERKKAVKEARRQARKRREEELTQAKNLEMKSNKTIIHRREGYGSLRSPRSGGASAHRGGISRRLVTSFLHLGYRRQVHSVGPKSFEYTPLFAFARATEDCDVNPNCAILMLVLDDPIAQELAFQAVREEYPAAERGAVYARAVTALHIERHNLSSLAPKAKLSSDLSYDHPPNAMQLLFTPQNPGQLAHLKKSLSEFTATVRVYYSEPSVAVLPLNITLGAIKSSTWYGALLRAAQRQNNLNVTESANLTGQVPKCEMVVVTPSELRKATVAIASQLGCLAAILSTPPVRRCMNLDAVAATLFGALSALFPAETWDETKHTLPYFTRLHQPIPGGASDGTNEKSEDDGTADVHVVSLDAFLASPDDLVLCVAHGEVADEGVYTMVDVTCASSSSYEDSNRQLVDIIKTLEMRLEVHEGTRSS